ncbi:TetR family transcriptional regulator [Paenibacillus cellulosilyticus]|uniref:TetR family transcriptional regulator n=1 Tax=Paenibacillus cellulosilyticus TaxID=375489 RepID=A0A2V2YE78_9BACL|nr:helix-turn-helix domain-containing protein [Paenibacillus cellulosilyticus]PWV90596.1 TetR family transcriptional regulator [Paenibacillus cellulosilyticus]QKS45239.1 TetR/AcrR family transcriptional regulator [Paenibacillus cellulosilyticus]
MLTDWHKDVRTRNREEFIAAGQEVLLENNFSKVGHKEVCERANLSKVTFYKCFNSMDDLIFAIQIKILGQVTEFMVQNSKEEETGLGSIRNYLDTWNNLLFTHPDYLKFIGFFDHIYSNQYPTETLKAAYHDVVVEAGFGNLLKDYIRKGVQDGSIRSDLPVELAVITILEMVISLMQRVASRGKILEEEHGSIIQDITAFSSQMIMDYLRAR